MEASDESKPSYPYSCDDLYGGRYPSELFWVQHQQWLQQQGYVLRPRFHLDWVPSWLGTDTYARDAEDGVPMLVRLFLQTVIEFNFNGPSADS